MKKIVLVALTTFQLSSMDQQTTITPLGDIKDQSQAINSSEKTPTLVLLQAFNKKSHSHYNPLHCAAFSPSNSLLATFSQSGIDLWNLSTGNSIATLPNPHKEYFYDVAFNGTGDSLVTTSWKGTKAHVWNAYNGALLHTLSGHTAKINSASFNAAGDKVVTSSNDRTAKIFNVAQGKVLQTFNGHKNEVYCAVFDTTGKKVLTSSADKTSKLWDASSGRLLTTFKGHTHSVNYAAFNSTGDKIVTTSDDRTAKLWTTTGIEIATLRGHGYPLYSAQFNTTGTRVLTFSACSARLWDASSGSFIAQFESAERGSIRSVCFNPSGELIFISFFHGSTDVRSAHDGAHLFALTKHTCAGEKYLLGEPYQYSLDNGATLSLTNTYSVPSTWDCENKSLSSYDQPGTLITYTDSDKVHSKENFVPQPSHCPHWGMVILTTFNRSGDVIFVTSHADPVTRVWIIHIIQNLPSPSSLELHTDSSFCTTITSTKESYHEQKPCEEESLIPQKEEKRVSSDMECPLQADNVIHERERNQDYLDKDTHELECSLQ